MTFCTYRHILVDKKAEFIFRMLCMIFRHCWCAVVLNCVPQLKIKVTIKRRSSIRKQKRHAINPVINKYKRYWEISV